MQQPTAMQLEAIRRVAARPEGVLILDYLTVCMNDVQQRMILDDDAQRVRAFQGEARALSVLLKVWKP